MLDLPDNIEKAMQQSILDELAATQKQLQDDIQSYVQSKNGELASDHISVQPLSLNSFLIRPASSQLIAYLQGKDWDTDLSGSIALAKARSRRKSRRRRRGGKIASNSKPKNLTPEQKVRQGLKSGKTLSLKHFDDIVAFNMVKKIFNEYIESDNFALFPVFMKELDDLIAIYRIRVGHEELDLPDEIEQEAVPYEEEK